MVGKVWEIAVRKGEGKEAVMKDYMEIYKRGAGVPWESEKDMRVVEWNEFSLRSSQLSSPFQSKSVKTHRKYKFAHPLMVRITNQHN